MRLFILGATSGLVVAGAITAALGLIFPPVQMQLASVTVVSEPVEATAPAPVVKASHIPEMPGPLSPEKAAEARLAINAWLVNMATPQVVYSDAANTQAVQSASLGNAVLRPRARGAEVRVNRLPQTGN